MRRCPRSQTLSYLIGGLPCLFPWQGETRHSWCWSSPNCVQLLTLTPCPCKQRLLFFKNAAKISSSSACNALEKPWHNIGICSPRHSLNPTQQLSTQLGTFEGVPAPGGHSPWPGVECSGWISAPTCSRHWAPSCSEPLAERWGCWGRSP